jgi:hypothetical protein
VNPVRTHGKHYGQMPTAVGLPHRNVPNMIFGRQLTRRFETKKGFGIFSALPNAILTFPIFVRLHLVNLGARSVVSIGTNYSGLRPEPGGPDPETFVPPLQPFNR